MVPRIAKRGHSFKGAGAYYLHDKNASTDERVAWTQTVNLLSRRPEKALKEMAWTDMHADDLRDLNGGSKVGRKSSAGNVYAYSLAWSPMEEPTKEQIQQASLETLQALGLEDHQALLVAHNDTDHSHVHVIVNLVNPDTGLVGNVHKDALRLSEWAEDYEHRCGVIHCEQRVKNNERREHGEYVKHEPEETHNAPSVEDLYHSCGSGSVFREAIEEIGYTLARGDRRGFVLVDREGEVHSLSRQLKGIRAKQIKTYMGDVDRENVQAAKDVQTAIAEAQDVEVVQDKEDDLEYVPESVSVSFTDIEDAFQEESAEKREALIDVLDKKYGQREQELKEEQHIQKALIDSMGFKGMWNAITGRTNRAKSQLAALRRRERKIREKRIAAVVNFEQKEEARRDDLKNCVKRREEYQRFLQSVDRYTEPDERKDLQSLTYE